MKEFLHTPYEGEKPYIFISYCHRDSELVFPIMEYLFSQGYRVWFDRGIHPGEEWQDVIADHLADSALFVAFVSKEYVESHNCRRELNFAVSENKSILPVILEEVQLTSAMKMQLASVQAITYYGRDSKDAFYRDFEKMPLLKSGLREGEPNETVETTAEEQTKPKTEKPKPQKSGHGKRWFAGIVVAILAVLAVVGVVLFQNRKGAGYNEKTMYKVSLTTEDMSVKDFNEALDTLKGRLDILTDGEKYEMQVEENTVKLLLPKKSFAGVEPENVLRSYISRAIKLYAVNPETLFMSDKESVSIDRDDLASVDLKEGTLDVVDKNELKELGMKGPSYKYVEIVLTDACAKRLERDAGPWKDNFVLAQDIALDPVYYHNTYPAGDGKTFYLVDENQESRFSEVIEYNLTHDCLAEEFEFTVEWDDIAWESCKKLDHPGKNQVDEDKLSGKTVTILYRTFDEKVKENKMDYVDSLMKDQFDTLGASYAYGHRDNKEQTVIAVKIGVEHIGYPILYAFGKQGAFSLKTGTTECMLNVNDGGGKMQAKQNSDGTYNVEVTVSEYQKATLEKMTLEMLERGEDTLYLGTYGSFQSFPLMAAEIRRPISDGKIVFTKSCFGKRETFTEEDLWIVDYIKVMSDNEMNMKYYFKMDQFQFNEDENGKPATTEDFGVSNRMEEQKIEQALRAVDKNVEVYFSKDNQICVALKLEVNEMLPEKSAELVQELYKSCEFEKSPYQNIIFFLIEEDDVAHEMARISVSKIYSMGEKGGDIVCKGAFEGGRLERYREDFLKIMAEDPFYKELITDLNLW